MNDKLDNNYVPPSADYAKRRLQLARWYFNPVFINSDKLDMGRPALFVGNHTLYGMLDIPFILHHMSSEHGVHLRSLGDRMHFSVPYWRDMLVDGGMVLGTPENCHQLMQAGESIMVFPGGAREVMRRKGEKYQLIWKQRVGFARMAIQHGYDIIPFASLGPDDCFDIVLDANDIKNSPVSQQWLKRLGLQDKIRGGDILPPIATGLLKLPVPKPQRFYFSFGARISTQDVSEDEAGFWQVREQVAQSIENQLEALKQYRTQDKTQNWGWLRKQLTGTTTD